MARRMFGSHDRDDFPDCSSANDGPRHPSPLLAYVPAIEAGAVRFQPIVRAPAIRSPPGSAHDVATSSGDGLPPTRRHIVCGRGCRDGAGMASVETRR